VLSNHPLIYVEISANIIYTIVIVEITVVVITKGLIINLALVKPNRSP